MRLHLIIDADDTLWENNIYFERAFDEFVAFLSHSTMTPGEVRAALDEIEIANNKIHGYGALNFGRNLQQCYERLVERDVEPDDAHALMAFAERIMHEPIEVIPGIEETLRALSTRHDLTLFTKGHAEEQKLKIDRSGLGVYFGHTAIVKEKNSAAYRCLATERGMDPERAWMIGNSPKSDIYPALEAGLGAIYVPHDQTWHLERMDLPVNQPRLRVVERFADLLEIFK